MLVKLDFSLISIQNSDKLEKLYKHYCEKFIQSKEYIDNIEEYGEVSDELRPLIRKFHKILKRKFYKTTKLRIKSQYEEYKTIKVLSSYFINIFNNKGTNANKLLIYNKIYNDNNNNDNDEEDNKDNEDNEDNYNGEENDEEEYKQEINIDTYLPYFNLCFVEYSYSMLSENGRLICTSRLCGKRIPNLEYISIKYILQKEKLPTINNTCFAVRCNDKICLANKFHVSNLNSSSNLNKIEYPYSIISHYPPTTSSDGNKYQNVIKLEHEEYFMKYFYIFTYLLSTIYNNNSLINNLLSIGRNELCLSSRMLSYINDKNIFTTDINLPMNNTFIKLIGNRILFLNKNSRNKIIKIIYIMNYYNNKIKRINYVIDKIIYY